MLRVPNSSREGFPKIQSPLWDEESFNSSRKMARFYFDQVTVASSPKPLEKFKIKKKLLFKEHKSTTKARSTLPFDESLFFQNHLCGLEHRTVNSLADTEDINNSVAEKPTRKRRRPRYIDSEVDLMINIIENRQQKVLDVQKHSSKYRNLAASKKAMQQQQQPVPQTNNVIEGDGSKKKLMKAKGTMVTSIALGKANPKMRKLQESPTQENALCLAKYPILMDKELVHKFLTVEMTNNQKGRLRQIMKEIVRGTTSTELPEVLNNKIQAILRSSADLTDTDLRKIRILYNMLKKATLGEAGKKAITTTKEGRKIIEDKTASPPDKTASPPNAVEEKAAVHKEKKHEKKNKKRYVVFVGNLPMTITKEEVLQLFNEIQNDVMDVRIPKLPPNPDTNKCAIAYVELRNRHSYEIALSKHHWMMGKRRIKVLYTTHGKSKLTSGEIKARQAKLLALQKKGKLIGSMSLNKKRSQRRAKQRKALAEKAQKESSKLLKVTNY